MKQSTKRLLKRVIKEEVRRALREEELSPDIVADYERRAEESDLEVDINMSIPTVSITRDDGEEWFFQEHEAEELLDSIPEDIHPETYLKVAALEW